MKQEFTTQIEAIDWIAENARDESHFEIMREELLFNQIYTGAFFIIMSNVNIEIALADKR